MASISQVNAQNSPARWNRPSMTSASPIPICSGAALTSTVPANG